MQKMFPIPKDHEPIPDTYNYKPLEKQYHYYNELGELVGYVGYYEKLDKKRRVMFFDYDKDTWHPRQNPKLKKLPLFRLNKLLSKPKDKKVAIVENERSAMALSKLKICAVSSVQGFYFIDDTDWTPLNGIEYVYLVKSNDENFDQFAEYLYLKFRCMTQPPKLRIVILPNLEGHDDLLRWLQKEHSYYWKGDSPIEQFKGSESLLNTNSGMANILPNIIQELFCEAHIVELEPFLY